MKAIQYGVIALMVIVLAACGNSNGASPASSPNPAAESPASSSQDTNSLAEEKGDHGEVGKLMQQFGTKKPEKIVTLSVSITEILHEIGVVPAGVPKSSSKLPEAFEHVPRIGSSHQPDLEQIAKLQPDIIVGPMSIKDSIEKKLKPASIPTAYLPADSLEQLKLSTTVLGRVFGHENKAKAYLEKIHREEQAILASVKGKPAPKVMILFGSAESLMLMNDNTFAGSIARNLGATNVLSEFMKKAEDYVPINMESVIAANPDVILLVAHGDPNAIAKKFEDDVKKNGAWEKMNAFKNGKMKALDPQLYGIASIVKAPAAYKDMAHILFDK
ncbi:helical backbone metal receptor [Paenibacillus sp. B1-33]|uniref:helical backbone metal receptor n=1 Tax=unclassified Paenibacillus TaxID=185978 RepID=UPI003D2B15D3